MAQEVRIAGATYQNVPSISVPDSSNVYHSFVDTSDANATASDILAPKTAYVNGVKVIGTGSGGGGGSVTQDQNGYIILPPTGGGSSPTLITKNITANGTYNASSDNADGYSSVTVNVSGGGGSTGLVYESGTWTPSTDVATTTISFTNTHTEAPFFYSIWNASEEYDATTYSNFATVFFNWEAVSGEPLHSSATNLWYGRTYYTYRTSSATGFSQTNTQISYPFSDSGDTTNAYPKYWATSTGIKASTNSSDRYWRSNQTYKWIAIWRPTT